MAATIQTIQKPTRARALDTSGNNNHGQIYSGRALEFDGVGDYLDIDTSILTGDKLTCAVWLKVSASASGRNYIFDYNDAGQRLIWAWQWDGMMVYDGGDADLSVAAPTTDGSWYHWVLTIDGTSVIAYMNGVQFGTATLASGALNMATGSSDFNIGSDIYGNHNLDGSMANLQFWDSVWSADDAMYAYLNPEQLALNRGGTSLTESNLKAWYPMQDGHRGQQSFILDGSPKELGSEMLTNGDFDSDTTGWTATRSVLSSDAGGQSGNCLTVLMDSGSEQYGYQTVTSVVGKTYKLTAWVKSGTSGDEAFEIVLWEPGLDSTFAGTSSSTWTEYTVYYTATTTTLGITLRKNTATAGTMLFDTVSAKEVKRGNHATTVFYGDMSELLTSAQKTALADALDANNSSFDFATGTTDLVIANGFTADNATFVNASGSGLLTNNDVGGAGGVSIPIATVAGRTYDVTIDTGAQNSTVAASLSTTTTFDNDYSTGYQSASQTGVRLGTKYVANDTTTFLVIKLASGVNTYYANVDNIKVQEVGTATGWTDADQQLDIPQTALQSYNQLMWFEGLTANTAVNINPGSDIMWNKDGDSDEWNTISCWVFVQDVTDSSTGCFVWSLDEKPRLWIIPKNKSVGDSDIELGYNTGNDDVVGVELVASTFENKWNHIVLAWKSNAVGDDTDLFSGADTPDDHVKIWINGEAQSLGSDYIQGSNSNEAVGDDAAGATSDLVLGHFADDGSGDYNLIGSITEVSAWKKQLSLAEVQELYNDGKALDARLHSAYNSTYASSDLKGYWRNNGLSSWVDLSGGDHNSDAPVNAAETLLIPAGVDGSRDNQGFLMNRQKDTNALNLPDQDVSYVNVGTYSGLTFGDASDDSVLSISAWVKTKDATNFIIVSKGLYDVSAEYKLFINASNILKFQCFDESVGLCYIGRKYDADISSVIEGKWVHIVATYSASETSAGIKIYLNNSRVDDADDQNNEGSYVAMQSEAADVHIGRYDTDYTDGQIDDVLIYSKELSVAEITRIYNAGKRSHR